MPQFLLSLFDALQFRLRMLRIALKVKPVEGGSPEGDGDEGDAGDADGDEGDGDGSGDEDGDDDSGNGDGDGEETVSMPKTEADGIRRELAELRRKQKQAERDAAAAVDRQKQEEGKWEELAEERKREADVARAELEAVQRQQRVTAAAARLKFRDPTDAYNALTEDELEDDASTEQALKRLAVSKPYLLTPEPGRRSAPVNAEGDNGGSPLTLDQIKGMSEAEVNQRWDDVQETLARSQGDT